MWEYESIFLILRKKDLTMPYNITYQFWNVKKKNIYRGRGHDLMEGKKIL